MADSIHSTAGTNAALPVAENVSSNYEGYFLESGAGDAIDFGELGKGAGTFLFSPNMMPGLNGTEIFSILSANVDPALGFIPLRDSTTKLTTFTVPAHGTQILPEPDSFYLALAGIAALSISGFGRVRAR